MKREYDNHGVITNSSNPNEVGKFRFQVNTRAGYVDNQPTADREEMLLPMGFTLQDNGEVETPCERAKRATTNKKSQPTKQVNEVSEMLLPAGIHLEG